MLILVVVTNLINAEDKYFYVMQIDVEDKKENGKPWDIAGNAPDIKVYINGELPQVIVPCKNSYRCKLLFISQRSFWYLEIYDKDVLADDLIGKGNCSIYKSKCRLGRSVVHIEKRVLKKVSTFNYKE